MKNRTLLSVGVALAYSGFVMGSVKSIFNIIQFIILGLGIIIIINQLTA